MLVPEGGEVIGDDSAAGLGEGFDALAFDIGEGEAGGEDEDFVVFGDAVLDDVGVGDEVVLESFVAEHVFPGVADEVGGAEFFVSVAVDPGFAVALGVEDPGELDGGVGVVDGDAILFPLGAPERRMRGRFCWRLRGGWGRVGRGRVWGICRG